MDPVLAIGETSTTVTVSAGAAVINTESATMSETFDQAQQEKAPLVSTFPDAYILLTLSPGVQGGNGDYPVINGQQQTQQAQSFDGIPDDIYGEQSNNSNFFEQSSATTFNAPAESAVPAAIELVTHRGTNAIHGVASYQIYDSVLNASSIFLRRRRLISCTNGTSPPVVRSGKTGLSPTRNGLPNPFPLERPTLSAFLHRLPCRRVFPNHH